MCIAALLEPPMLDALNAVACPESEPNGESYGDEDYD
jgi:hypothetical protein